MGPIRPRKSSLNGWRWEGPCIRAKRGKSAAHRYAGFIPHQVMEVSGYNEASGIRGGDNCGYFGECADPWGMCNAWKGRVVNLRGVNPHTSMNPFRFVGNGTVHLHAIAVQQQQSFNNPLTRKQSQTSTLKTPYRAYMLTSSLSPRILVIQSKVH